MKCIEYSGESMHFDTGRERVEKRNKRGKRKTTKKGKNWKEKKKRKENNSRGQQADYFAEDTINFRV